MSGNFKFNVNGEEFEGYVIPVFELKVGIYDNKSNKIVTRTVRLDDNDNPFFTWNGKSCFIVGTFDDFEIEVR